MKRLFLSFLATLFLITLGFAQSNTGNLIVNVSDASGVIPGATVVVTDNQTGKERTFTTGNEGSVSIPQLEVGTFTVKVSAPDRKTKIINNVKIDIAQTYTLNAVLEAGNIAETVEVTAGTELINSSGADISRTVGTREIQELPLNGRNPLALITTQAGSSSNGATNTVINGQRTSFTNITRDGLTCRTILFVQTQRTLSLTGRMLTMLANLQLRRKTPGLKPVMALRRFSLLPRAVQTIFAEQLTFITATPPILLIASLTISTVFPNHF